MYWQAATFKLSRQKAASQHLLNMTLLWLSIAQRNASICTTISSCKKTNVSSEETATALTSHRSRKTSIHSWNISITTMTSQNLWARFSVNSMCLTLALVCVATERAATWQLTSVFSSMSTMKAMVFWLTKFWKKVRSTRIILKLKQATSSKRLTA